MVAPEFRLRFLRAELYDIGKAALRYFKNLNYLLRYFGNYALMRPLELSDLTSFQRQILESGKLQILLHRDRMGRRMLLVFGNTLAKIPILDRFRVETYLVFGAIAEDEETQLNGATCITIFHPNGGPNSNDENQKSAKLSSRGVGEKLEQQQEHRRHDRHQRQTTNFFVDGSGWDETEKRTFAKLFRRTIQGTIQGVKLTAEHSEASPVRWSSIHLCVPDNRVFRFYKGVLLGMIPSKYRSMTKIHFGSQLECMYELSQFGIPAEDLGMNIMRSKSLGKFLKARASVEGFRWDFYSKHGVKYYQTTSKLPREHHKNYQQQNVHSNEITTAEETQTLSSSSAVAAAPLSPPASEASKLSHEPNFGRSMNFFCPVTDCPVSNCVVFGDRLTYKYPANIAFREYLREFLRTKIVAEDDGNSTTNASLRLNAKILDQIIDETCAISHRSTPTASSANWVGAADGHYLLPSKRFEFALYDKTAGWYRYVLPFQNESDRVELRKRISQTVRDDRKKRTMMNNNNRANHDRISSANAASTISSTFQNGSAIDRQVFYAKRLKTNHDQCWNVFGPFE